MKLVVILFLILFVLMSIDKHTPFWSQNRISIASDSEYSPQKKYNFEINWTDSDLGMGGISKVLFETDFSGVLMNYSNDTNPKVMNNTKGIYWINFTDLKSGNYVFRWYANDTSDHFNLTDQSNYSINKNSSYSMKLFLNGTEGNRSYKINERANFTALLKISNKTIYLNSNYPDWILQNGTSVIYSKTKLNSSGLFTLTTYWDGDENYTSKSITSVFDNRAPQYVNNVAYPSSGIGYYPDASYQFIIGWSDATLKEVLFKSNHTGSLRTYNPSNSSGVFSINFEDLPAGNFTYEWTAKDSINLENSTGQKLYNIQKRSPLALELSPSTTVDEGRLITVKCFSSTDQIRTDKFKLFRNSELVNNASISVREESKNLPGGIYVYVCNTTGNQNFTNQSLSITLTVNSITTPLMLKISDTYFPALYIGKSTEAEFTILNNYSENLFDISVNLIGIPSNWYKIEDFQTILSNKSSQKIKINFSVPSNAEAKSYSILITVKGKTVSGTKTATETVDTIVYKSSEPPRENKPPEYLEHSVDNTASGKSTIFSLKIRDDYELSGYIFSTNLTGSWKNDTWVQLYGTEDEVYTSKTLNLPSDSIIAWKVYSNDSNNIWSTSEVFYLRVSGVIEKQIDYTTSITIGIIAIVFVLIVIIIIHKTAHRKPKEKHVHYVYKKEDLHKQTL